MFSLNGSWFLNGRQESGKKPEIFTDGQIAVNTTVPGNIEESLWQNGFTDDPYIYLNARQLRKYEFYEWVYSREFEYNAVSDNIDLVCEGIDCIATIWINGKKAGECANAFIPHRFPVAELLQNGKNTIAIHIASANNAYRDCPFEISTLTAYPFNYESTRIRKPAHAWGWDITPRMAIGGIFRNIYLEAHTPFRIVDDMLNLESISGKGGRLLYACKIQTPEYTFDDLELSVSGTCGEDTWTKQSNVWSAQCRMWIKLEKISLWWPRNYGKANLYDITVQLKRKSTGKVLAEHKFTTGLRTIKLQAAPTWTESKTPDFQFIVNNVPVIISGCNHVPVDALHSKDRERLPEVLDMACDLNCNMLRVWGGGVYEDKYFYDRCDREGILVWQDFMLGCANYPTDDAFLSVMKAEAEKIIPLLRKHPCIALWAGDNECDCTTCWGVPLDPNQNLITGQIFPEICRRLDPYRPYLPSSPWMSPEAVKAAAERGMPDPMFMASEQHLWGPRDYFKSEFYSKTKASFSSEIGYHGCPGVSSIKKFISPDKIWGFQNNEEWDYHASNPFLPDDTFLNYRTQLMADQVKEMFGTVPETLEDFALASQICQAEAKKYFIELMRSNQKMTGVLWWNLVDCWPQFSDAVVDYYFNKKLAYQYIKRLQHPVLVQVTDARDWQQQILASNVSNSTVSGSYTVTDADTGEIFSSGDFTVNGGDIIELDAVKVCTTRQHLLLIKWQLDDGTTGVNHALCGYPQFKLEQYRNWLPQIAGLDGAFDAATVAK